MSLSHGAAQFMNAARTVDHEFGGQVWKFSIWRYRDHMEKAEYINSRTRSPLDSLSQLPGSLDPASKQAVQQFLAKMASGLMITSREDEQAFDDSKEGTGYAVWRALRDNHEEFGMLTNGAVPRHTVGSGPGQRGYGMTPEEGVETAHAWIDAFCHSVDDYQQLTLVLLGLTEEDLVGNSSGPKQSGQPSPAAAEQ
jgi:hypothetical protein